MVEDVSVEVAEKIKVKNGLVSAIDFMIGETPVVRLHLIHD